MKPGPPKGSGGRPRVEVPMDLIETACRFNATSNQVMEALRSQGYHFSADTMWNAIEAQHGVTFSQFRDQRTDLTKLKLVQKAVNMALDGHAVMLIFCLKNMCDWRDKPKDEMDEFSRLSLQELIVMVKQKLPMLEAASAPTNDVTAPSDQT